MNTGDALHGAAIAQRQATAVDVLQHADVRAAVPGQRNLVFRRQHAGHRGIPQEFAVQLGVGKAVDLVQALQGIGDVGHGRGDEFQQRFGIIGGDQVIGQGRTQRRRMGRAGQMTLAVHAQRLPFHAAQALAQQRKMVRLGKLLQAAGEEIGHAVVLGSCRYVLAAGASGCGSITEIANPRRAPPQMPI